MCHSFLGSALTSTDANIDTLPCRVCTQVPRSGGFEGEVEAGRRWLHLRVYCLPYVYVVRVNKGPRFLWITLDKYGKSVVCRTHNRLHSMCGDGCERRVTFGPLAGCRKLPRLRPHALHTCFTCNSRGCPQTGVDNVMQVAARCDQRLRRRSARCRNRAGSTCSASSRSSGQGSPSSCDAISSAPSAAHTSPREPYA